MARRKLNLLCILIVIGMLSPAAMALDLLGAPMAGLDQGQWLFGAEYSFSNMDVEVSGPLAGLNGDSEIDLDTNKYFARIAYGLSGDWEIFGLLGMADADFEADAGGEDFNGSTEFAYGIGTKKTLAQNDNTTWGVIFQYTTAKSYDRINRASTYGSNAISAAAGSRLRLDWYELMLAFGMTVEENEQCTWYCGPFVHLLEGDIEESLTAQNEYEIEQGAELGGFLGAIITLAENITANIEGQITTSSWLVGGGIQIRH